MRVSLVLQFLHHFRVPFLEGLRDRLSRNQIELDLIYGKNPSVPRKDERDVAWGRPVANHYYGLAGRTVCWQEIPDDIYKSDLVILTQGNVLVRSHLIQARIRARGGRVALYGHGINFQAPRDCLANRLKKFYTVRASWWFAYTKGVKEILTGMGFPAERITIVQNAIDTRLLREQAAALSEAQVNELRRELGVGAGPVGLYCGGLYREKRLPFMVEAGGEIRKRIPGFEFVVVGAGVDADWMRGAAR
jgi:glycosyltransferase involved in cell wall biosynthesis